MCLRQTSRRQSNTAHAFYMFDNWGNKHTLSIRNTYCFPTATVVAWTRLSVTLYVLCLSCLILMSICLCHLLLPIHNCTCISKNLRPLQSVVSKRGLQFQLVVKDVVGFTLSRHSCAVVGLRISAVSYKISWERRRGGRYAQVNKWT
jgi:hypothetical protein